MPSDIWKAVLVVILYSSVKYNFCAFSSTKHNEKQRLQQLMQNWFSEHYHIFYLLDKHNPTTELQNLRFSGNSTYEQLTWSYQNITLEKKAFYYRKQHFTFAFCFFNLPLLLPAQNHTKIIRTQPNKSLFQSRITKTSNIHLKYS